MEKRTYFSSTSSSSTTSSSSISTNYLYRSTCRDQNGRPCTKTYTNYITDGNTLRSTVFSTPYQEHDEKSPIDELPDYVAAMVTKMPKNPSNTTDFQAQCLEEHNTSRARHGMQPLTLNSKLCIYATEWAEKLARSNKMQHRKDNKYGENLYMSCGKDIDGRAPVKAWYDEVKNYSFKNGKFGMNTGHFTQVVWKSSQQLGVGVARTGATTYVVCNYDPPGNYAGQFADNVLPPL